MKTMPAEMYALGRELMNRKKYGNSGGPKNRGILTDIKVAELPHEKFSEFSNAPFDFEESVSGLWEDTQVIYYHACVENRFSDNYLKYSELLEKNISQIGSFCLTKTLLEKKGLEFPKLADLSILELVKMVSYHFRKCRAAFRGIYHDNDLIGVNYLQWEFRWFRLGNRLKATEVKIGKILDGTLSADDLLRQAETFKGEKCSNEPENDSICRSVFLNPQALPIKGTMARRMLGIEQEKERLNQKREKALHRIEQVYGGEIFKPAESFRPRKVPMEQAEPRMPISGAESRSAYGAPVKRVETTKPERPAIDKAPEGAVTEAEARKILIEEAIRNGDHAAMLAIPLEDVDTFHKRWLRHIGQPPEPSPPRHDGTGVKKKRKKR